MTRVISEDYLSHLLHAREPFSHKNDFGNALLVAGSRGMMGAALLSARACMRSGVGLLTVRVPRCGYEIMQLGIPEAKCETDNRTDYHTHIEWHSGIDAVAIGPGLGLNEETQDALINLLHRGLSIPGLPDPALILDADALNILSLHPHLLDKLPKDTILTPHPGEAKRLLDATGCGNSLVLAMKYNVVVILKDHYTNIHLPDGNIFRNENFGNAGMAVGGSGDTLTGILLGLRAQGYSAQDASILGVSLHAMAADLAIEQGGQSEESLLPSDIIAWLGAAFKEL
ncbi:MAG: NAD(P)H-hydrate dehydratase [Bacteroidales bacterium]|nr:NAD(P)H-hydrate dehydratase [Bacteroidales bacterium]